MLPSILLYGALLALLVGLVALVRPLHRLGIRTRVRALALLAASAIAIGAVTCAPIHAVRVSAVTTRLDEFSPAYHVNEVHRLRVAAPPDRVYAAIKAVTADDIALFRTFTWLRRFGRAGPESILNPPDGTPLLDVVTRTTFLLLADEPSREVVVGTIVLVSHPGDIPRARTLTVAEYRDLSAPGFVKATMNFHLEPDGPDATLLTTETRVFGTDDEVMRRFVPYWRVILPGSAILRVTWLQAIQRRATATPDPLAEASAPGDASALR